MSASVLLRAAILHGVLGLIILWLDGFTAMSIALLAISANFQIMALAVWKEKTRS